MRFTHRLSVLSGLSDSMRAPATERCWREPEGHERERPPPPRHLPGTHRVREGPARAKGSSILCVNQTVSVTLFCVSRSVRQAGLSVPEARSITDGGGRAGSWSPQYRRPGCQCRHCYFVSAPSSLPVFQCFYLQLTGLHSYTAINLCFRVGILIVPLLSLLSFFCGFSPSPLFLISPHFLAHYLLLPQHLNPT